MRRLLVLAAALVGFTTPALAQEDPTPPPPRTVETWSGQRVPVERSTARPPDPLPSKPIPTAPRTIKEASRAAIRLADDDLGSLADTLSEAQILRRISRVYQYQADLLTAQANGDAEHAERLLDLAMTEIGTLAQQPDITERPRFRELYRTVVTEYERYYGVSDAALTLPHGSIFQFRADMFAELDDVDNPLLEDVMLPRLPPMETVFPMTTNRLVERSIDFMLNQRRTTLKNWMSRADTYFPMIEQIFREEGVPDELKYLALVESGLNPRARSWARAAGMWQFIQATGGSYGLQTTAWVDDRLDPEQATRAAARHLKDLYEMYDHDWQVAIAGYNCSPRCIKRAGRKAGGSSTNQPTFWEMYPYLPRETRGYVPLFIATALMVSNPDAFGLTDASPGPRYAYDLVPVQGMLSLVDVARMAGTDVAMIKALNPALLRDTLPPSKGAYPLRIPAGAYAQFAEAFEQLPETARRPAGEYVVRRGDSLGKIAQQYGLSVADLKSANNLRSATIHPGQRLVVPVPSYSGAVSLADARPVTVEYGVRSTRPIAPSTAATLASERPPVVQASDTSTPARAASTSAAPPKKATPKPTETRVVYKVRRGDTLGKIAQKYGTSVSKIKQWNNLRGTTIKSGQKLYLYASEATPSQPERIVYKVRRGDNLTKIAQKYGVSVSSLRAWNNLRGSTIRVGQRLTIHPGQTAPQYVVYKVRRGDSLGKIAKKYGTSVSKIKQWNKLRKSTIYPGQRLRIYT